MIDLTSGDCLEFSILNSTDSKEWLKISSLSEGDYYQSVLDDKRLSDIGAWGLDYLKVFNKGENVAICTIVEQDELNFFIAGLVVKEKYRNLGIGSQIIKFLVNRYKKISLLTRNELLKKIIIKYGFICTGREIGEYSNLEEEKYYYEKL